MLHKSTSLCPSHNELTGTEWLSRPTAHAFPQPPVPHTTLHTPRHTEKTSPHWSCPGSPRLSHNTEAKQVHHFLPRERPAFPGQGCHPQGSCWTPGNAPAGPTAHAMGKLSSRWQTPSRVLQTPSRVLQTPPTSRPCSRARFSARQPPWEPQPQLGCESSPIDPAGSHAQLCC